MENASYNKITHFTDLIAWQEGHKLVLKIYSLTSHFPQQETYALLSQMRRAAVSITSNLAEGFSRRTSKEKTQFYTMSLGSLDELHNQLLIARDVKHITVEMYQTTTSQIEQVRKLIVGLIKHIR